VEESKDNVRNDLLHNASSNDVSKNQKKVKEYFAKLSKVEQDKLIKKFEAEKIYG